MDISEGIVSLADGKAISSDLIICADGISSRTRSTVIDIPSCSPRPLQDSVYRAMLPRAVMMSRPETDKLISTDSAQLFMGPKRALLAYPIAQGKLYNIAITALDTNPSSDTDRIGRWNDPVDINELKRLFHDFCPQVQSLLGLVETCTKWTIAEVPPLETWSSKSGRVVLLGDAAHAMSPHLAQGSAMAIEDAAVLGECLQRVESTQCNLTQALQWYEQIRKPRVERIAGLARQNGASMLLEDGPEQEQRDRKFGASLDANQSRVMTKVLSEAVADQNAPWATPAFSKWLYGFDALKDAQIRLERLSGLQNSQVTSAELRATN
ncbi:hypothetical protein LTR84_009890 [Exophiala bonariae]|uniref:FAD-binding domain-containing protein n=1 Tax=Exophiala bonariae TaxID=1690606 RepID=A0AAV9NJY4_9EURO|nr:hypothetical protein LTR84_009890 [Exophiala bonariae]